MGIADTIFLVVIIMFSAIIHEVMHGVAADRLGDPTARYAGRLTLNPIPHLDPIGSVILPLIIAFTHFPIFFAWAKPVPYNPYNLRAGRFSEAIVAAAGPLSNFVFALVAAAVVRFVPLDPTTLSLVYLIVVVNVMLFLFNLIPIPPLDGSKVIEAVIPPSWQHAYHSWRFRLDANPMIGFLIVILFVYVFGSAFANAVYAVAGWIAGM